MKRPVEERIEEGGNNKRSKMVFQTRCNPKLNYKILQKYKDSPPFRKVVNEVGLTGLLELRITRLQRELCFDLAKRLDCKNKVLRVHGKEIPLGYPSVTKLLGLPCIGSSLMTNIEIGTQELAAVCNKFNLDTSGKISMYTLKTYLHGPAKIDEEFKVKFVLFTIATLLRPTSNIHLHFREYIPYINDMMRFTEFNWAKFVLDGLLEAVSAFQTKSAKSLGGCLLYLQLLYLHCICPVSWGVHDECLLATPSLSNWNDKRVTGVLKIMEEQGDLDTDKVAVQTLGLPVTTTNKISVIPQLLMHQIYIQQIQKREADRETDAVQHRGLLNDRLAQIDRKLDSLYQMCTSKFC